MKTRCGDCGKEGEAPLPFPDYSIGCLCGTCVRKASEGKIVEEWPDCEIPECLHKVCLWGVPGKCHPHGVEAIGKEAMDRLYSETHGGKTFEEESETKPQVNVPEMCQRHQHKLVHGAGLGPNDVWRVLILVAQIALFQGATATPSVHKRLEGNIENITKLGCLACRLPGKFELILRKGADFTAIKAMGESWVNAGTIKQD